MWTQRIIFPFCIAFLVGGTLLVNPVQEIPDVPHLSALFIGILFSLPIGLVAFVFTKHLSVRVTSFDLFFAGLLLFAFCKYPPTAHLWGLGYFSLLLIYWSIRFSGRLHACFWYHLLLATLLVLSLSGYLQWYGLLPSHHFFFKITGPYASPTVYGGVLALLWCIPWSVLWSVRRNHFPGYLYAYSLLLCMFSLPVLYWTNCRAAWLALLTVTVYLVLKYLICFSYFGKRKQLLLLAKRPHFRWIVGCIALVCIASFAYALSSLKPDSANGRVLIWKVTAQMIGKRPLTGFSPQGFAAEYMHFQADYLKRQGTPTEKWLADNNHYVYNELLRWWVEYGIIGLLFYILFVCQLLCYKEWGIRSLCAKMVCLAALSWGFFSYPDHVFPVLLLCTFAMAELSNQERKTLFRLPRLSSSFSCIVIIGLIAWMSVRLAGVYRSYRDLHYLSLKSAVMSQSEMLASLAHLEASMEHETLFWLYYCHMLDKYRQDSLLLEKLPHWEQLYPSTHTYVLKGDALQRLGRLGEAETAYTIASYMVPSRQRARYKLALLYIRQGRTAETVKLAKEILSEKVKSYGFETYEMHRDLKQILEHYKE